MGDSGLRRSISGIRGTAEDLTDECVETYTKGFGTFLRDVANTNTMVVGRDTRSTSRAHTDRAIDALLSGGWDVVDLGVVPTPTVQIAIAKFEAAGGVMITASHNPAEYNGLKFLQNFEGNGMFLRKEQIDKVFAIRDAGTFDSRRPGGVRKVADLASEFDDPPYTSEYLARTRSKLSVDNAVILDYHLHRVISAMGRDLDLIRAKNFSVAMDCCGGAGSPINYVLLDYLYARIKKVNEAPGVFTRAIEPTPANLSALCEDLARDDVDYDVGFVTDCDNDRCVLVARDPDAGTYQPLEEDYTFAIAVDHVLGVLPHGRTVVTNWSTSQMIKDICRSHHANLRRVPTGEVYTASDALHFRAVIAGEGSCAGVIDPRVGMGRDLLVAVWHVLAALASSNRCLIDIANQYPKHSKCNRDHKTGLSVEQTHQLLEKLQLFYAANPDLAFISREDGLIVALKDHSRVQIRASNTEPVLRVRATSPDSEKAASMADEAIEFIQQNAQ